MHWKLGKVNKNEQNKTNFIKILLWKNFTYNLKIFFERKHRSFRVWTKKNWQLSENPCVVPCVVLFGSDTKWFPWTDYLLDGYVTSQEHYPKENSITLILFSFGYSAWLVTYPHLVVNWGKSLLVYFQIMAYLKPK